MKPASFAYARARSLDEALELLKGTDAKALAGGQSLLTLMNFRMARPALLVDIGDLEELKGIAVRSRRGRSYLALGALVRHRQLETDPVILSTAPLVSLGARHIGHMAIRNRGTLGGSLAHADPAAELSSVLVALEATVNVVSQSRGTRTIDSRDLFVSHYTTTLAEDELITGVEIPAAISGEGYGFREVTRRPGDFAISGAACLIKRGPEGEGPMTRIRACLFAISDSPLVVSDDGCLGEHPEDDLLRDLATEWTPKFLQDDRYRWSCTRSILYRTLRDAAANAVSSTSGSAQGRHK